MIGHLVLAAEHTSWPDAVENIAVCALIAFVIWALTR